MSDITRLLVNLGVSYAMMNREEFTERFTHLFEKYNMDREKLNKITEAIMMELEGWRDRKNMSDVMEDAQKNANSSLEKQIEALAEEIRKLNEELSKSKEK
ncbi:MAG: hypothetical protein GC180_08930 [Bacteroidetes bacterium]|nr:hypothetical protein [Bacteroidota bacterium]